MVTSSSMIPTPSYYGNLPQPLPPPPPLRYPPRSPGCYGNHWCLLPWRSYEPDSTPVADPRSSVNTQNTRTLKVVFIDGKFKMIAHFQNSLYRVQ